MVMTPEQIEAQRIARLKASGGLGAAVAAGTPYTPREDDVAKIATGYMSQDNALMQRARAQGQRAAGQRGLLNSTMAGQGAQAAVLDVVVPMASQTAQQGYGHNLSRQGFEQGIALGEQGYVNESALSKQGFGQNSALSTQGFNQDKALSAQGFRQSADLNRQQFGLQKILQTLDNEAQARLSREGFNVQRELAALETQTNTHLARMNLTAEAKRAAGGALSQAVSTYSSVIANILANPNMSAAARTKAIASAGVTRDREIAAVEKIYSIRLPNF